MLPNFLVVGAAKSGTTSLHEYLNSHPQVFVPQKKECLFFSELDRFDGPGHDQELNGLITRSIEEYKRLFDSAGEALMRGDLSHDYLYYFERSIGNIKHHLGDQVRIVMILRDPRERAYSHYMHHIKVGISPDSSFEKALAREEGRIRNNWSWNWHYTRASLYAQQVAAYLEAFPHVRIYLYDDLVADAPGLMRDLFSFLGVDERVIVEAEVHNQGSDVRNRQLTGFLRRESGAKEQLRKALKGIGISDELIHQLKKRALAWNRVSKSQMNAATRTRLNALFAEDIERLEQLIERDLSAWRR